MYIYRPHRSLLIDSLAEAKEFNTKEEMFKYIVDSYSRPGETPPFGVKDLVIDKMSTYDDRIEWYDSRYVCIRRFYNEYYTTPHCIGMCATKYESYRKKSSNGRLFGLWRPRANSR